MNKHLKCTGAYGTYGISKLSSFMCLRVGRYPTSLWMLYGIVSGHPRCVRRGIRVEDDTRVRLDPARLFDCVMNGCHSWCLWACVCCVIRFIPLQGWLLIPISATPSDMGDGLFGVFKRSNSTFIMLLIS
jgi:hypothetical protein